MKTILNLINCMVGTVGAILSMALRKEGKFGQAMNKAFKGVIVLNTVINTIHYTSQIESLETRIIVFGVEIVLSILYIISVVDIKLDKIAFWTL
ncbi:hypothetical protein [uncultured Tissierella sp.]|uniref:hypothetical protein n=1 Tax=uncultured Tissierella sp. TaxID=448160 RepID=UPI002804D8F0|nr:hypothetical protein [uncultured Tissierella sp.]MDU5082838.1 hypothetical protein [Bacillota bacterium]